MFIGLVVVHELGHFFAARRNGVEVEEFGIGFPPRAWVKRMKSGFNLSINWLPLGGFVRLKGEHDSARSKGSFGAASLPAKVKIMLAGVAMNLLTAFVLLTIAAWAGVPLLVDNQFTVGSDTKIVRNEVLVGYVEDGSPAQQAGLEQRDQLVAVSSNGHREAVASAEALPDITENFAGQTVTVEYIRGDSQRETTLQLRTHEAVEASRNTAEPKGYIGIAPTEYTVRRSTWSAPVVAAGLIKQFTELTFKGIGTAISSLFQGDTTTASEQVAGPVGIFVLLRDGSILGYEFVLMVIAVISLTLAIMNVLPIPALDGGRLFVTLLFRAFKKPLSQRTEEWIHGTGFAMLMGLFLLITIVDIRRFF